MNKIIKQIAECAGLGLIPYVATSEIYLPHINMDIFGGKALVKLMEREEDRTFHQSYVFANFLGFGGSGVEMPGWVYLDCVLMQTAVFGFAVHRDMLPPLLVEKFRNHATIHFENVDYVPITGQTCALGMDGETLIGFSLVSLSKYFPEAASWPKLGILSKAMGLLAQNAHKRKQFLGIAQYNNPAIKIHGRFCKDMIIQTPMMPLHPLTDLTFIYSMQIEFDDDKIFGERESNDAAKYDFLMRYDDTSAKEKMIADIKQGAQFIIPPPFQIEQDGVIFVPIKKQ